MITKKVNTWREYNVLMKKLSQKENVFWGNNGKKPLDFTPNIRPVKIYIVGPYNNIVGPYNSVGPNSRTIVKYLLFFSYC